jgi:hypothetical protein
MSTSDFFTIGLIVVVTSATSNVIGVLIAGPIVNKYLHKLSFEDIKKYPLAQGNKLIKNLIKEDSVPYAAKRCLKLSLVFRITSMVLFYSLMLFLVACCILVFL